MARLMGHVRGWRWLEVIGSAGYVATVEKNK